MSAIWLFRWSLAVAKMVEFAQTSTMAIVNASLASEGKSARLRLTRVTDISVFMENVKEMDNSITFASVGKGLRDQGATRKKRICANLCSPATKVHDKRFIKRINLIKL